MASVNELLRDATIHHAVDLLRYANGIVARILALINKVDEDLFLELSAALERLPPESFTVNRLDVLLGSVRILNGRAYKPVAREMADEMRALVDYEIAHQEHVFHATIPRKVMLHLGIVGVDVDQVYSAAMSQPFRGRLLKDWEQDIEADRMVRIRDAVRMGYVENQTTAQIVSRIRGTKKAGYSDGIIEIDRRSAEAVVRTAVGHTAAFTREKFIEANTDLVGEVQWVSTLDSRTTLEFCIPRDGKRYTADTHKPVGHKLPWLAGPGRIHWCCRSTMVPITKSWRELGIDMDEMDPGTRASVDGQVAGDITYQQWLAKQSASRQDEVLGKTRGRLFREGGLTVDKFSTRKGELVTLDDLRQSDAEAFKRAGV